VCHEILPVVRRFRGDMTAIWLLSLPELRHPDSDEVMDGARGRPGSGATLSRHAALAALGVVYGDSARVRCTAHARGVERDPRNRTGEAGNVSECCHSCSFLFFCFLWSLVSCHDQVSYRRSRVRQQGLRRRARPMRSSTAGCLRGGDAPSGMISAGSSGVIFLFVLTRKALDASQFAV